MNRWLYSCGMTAITLCLGLTFNPRCKAATFDDEELFDEEPVIERSKITPKTNLSNQKKSDFSKNKNNNFELDGTRFLEPVRPVTSVQTILVYLNLTMGTVSGLDALKDLRFVSLSPSFSGSMLITDWLALGLTANEQTTVANSSGAAIVAGLSGRYSLTSYLEILLLNLKSASLVATISNSQSDGATLSVLNALTGTSATTVDPNSNAWLSSLVTNLFQTNKSTTNSIRLTGNFSISKSFGMLSSLSYNDDVYNYKYGVIKSNTYSGGIGLVVDLSRTKEGSTLIGGIYSDVSKTNTSSQSTSYNLSTGINTQNHFSWSLNYIALNQTGGSTFSGYALKTNYSW